MTLTGLAQIKYFDLTSARAKVGCQVPVLSARPCCLELRLSLAPLQPPMGRQSARQGPNKDKSGSRPGLQRHGGGRTLNRMENKKKSRHIKRISLSTTCNVERAMMGFKGGRWI